MLELKTYTYSDLAEILNCRSKQALERKLDSYNIQYFSEGNRLPKDKNHFIVTAEIEVSDQFYGWLCGFGKKVKIASPSTAAKAFTDYLDTIKSNY